MINDNNHNECSQAPATLPAFHLAPPRSVLKSSKCPCKAGITVPGKEPMSPPRLSSLLLRAEYLHTSKRWHQSFHSPGQAACVPIIEFAIVTAAVSLDVTPVCLYHADLPKRCSSFFISSFSAFAVLGFNLWFLICKRGSHSLSGFSSFRSDAEKEDISIQGTRHPFPVANVLDSKGAAGTIPRE